MKNLLSHRKSLLICMSVEQNISQINRIFVLEIYESVYTEILGGFKVSLTFFSQGFTNMTLVGC